MSIKLNYNGNDYSEEIVAGGAILDMSHAMVGETLSVDTLSVPMMTEDIPMLFLAADQDEGDLFYTADDKILCAFAGTPTPAFIKNGVGRLYFGDDLIGAYYLDELTQSGPNEHVMRFLSGIRLLDRSDHQGGLYSGELAGDVIDDIVAGIVPYTIDADIAEIPVYGYLPYARRRNNLQYVLMAIGAAVRNNPDGSLRITQLSDTVTGTIDESRVFFGGSVVSRTPATAVQVTEHNYLPSEDEVTLYDGVTLETETIKFAEPIHDLVITGGTILDSGVNFCTFEGAGAVVLTGKHYNHVTRIITVGTTPTGVESDVVKRITNNTLLSPINAAQVAERLYGYLSAAQSIKQEVILGSERPSDVVQVVHPYTRELIEACIKSMRVTFGRNEHRALCEFLVGYKPPGATTGFENHALLTAASGTWTVPAGVTQIRVILFGGGSGGNNGGDGTSPSGTSTSTPVNVGQGGKGGEGGNGGFVLEINLNVTPGNQFNYACGDGGMSETEGGATLFGSYTSSMGRRYPYGYTEPKTGLTFGVKGGNGVDGRPGNNWQEAGEPLEYNGVTYYGGSNGDNYYNSSQTGYGQGGGGGGAAVGNNGGNGTDASYSVVSTFYFRHGNGGNGANAAAGDDATEYGAGGQGGHGGGGGGYAIGDLPGINDIAGIVGQGGSGGSGGKGGPGCIVIYF